MPELNELIQLGNQLTKENKYQEVLSLLSDDVLNKNNDPELFSIRGVAQYNLEKYQEAIADYTKTIELDPNKLFAHFWLGASWYYLEDYGKSVDEFSKRLKNNPMSMPVIHSGGWPGIVLRNMINALKMKRPRFDLTPKINPHLSE